MNYTAAHAFLSALETEAQELDAKLAEYEPIRRRREGVTLLIQQVRAFVIGHPETPERNGAANGDLQAALGLTADIEVPPKVDMTELIVAVLRDANEFLGAAEIYRRVQARGWKPTKAGREVVRGYLMRRTDVFHRRDTDGLYGLREWPAGPRWATEEGTQRSVEEEAPLGI